MSAARATILTCDQCEETKEFESLNYRDAREEARAAGWLVNRIPTVRWPPLHDRRADFCPKCAREVAEAMRDE